MHDRLDELGIPSDGLPLGIAHDPPHVTAPERLRFDAGWTIDRELPPECGLGQQTVGGGAYAFTTFVGPFSEGIGVNPRRPSPPSLSPAGGLHV